MKHIPFGLKVLLLITLAGLSACASPGPKYSEVRRDIPALRDGQSRIYTYRTSYLGAALKPDVRLNGEPIGAASAGTVSFIDVEPGTYQMACTTEKTNEVTFKVVAGETKYVRLVPYMGILVGRISPEVVTENEGEADVQGLALVIPPQMQNRVPATLLKK